MNWSTSRLDTFIAGAKRDEAARAVDDAPPDFEGTWQRATRRTDLADAGRAVRSVARWGLPTSTGYHWRSAAVLAVASCVILTVVLSWSDLSRRFGYVDSTTTGHMLSVSHALGRVDARDEARHAEVVTPARSAGRRPLVLPDSSEAAAGELAASDDVPAVLDLGPALDDASAAPESALTRVERLPHDLHAVFGPLEPGAHGLLYVARDYLARTGCDSLGECVDLQTESIVSAHCAGPDDGCVVRTTSCEGTVRRDTSGVLIASLRSVDADEIAPLCARLSGRFEQIAGLERVEPAAPTRKLPERDQWRFVTAKIISRDHVDDGEIRDAVRLGRRRFQRCFQLAKARGLDPAAGVWIHHSPYTSIRAVARGDTSNIQLAFARGQHDRHLESCLRSVVRRFDVDHRASFSLALVVTLSAVSE